MTIDELSHEVADLRAENRRLKKWGTYRDNDLLDLRLTDPVLQEVVAEVALPSHLLEQAEGISGGGMVLGPALRL